ncbi:hypothetical protein [Labrenzia sp. OB1]|uniref:hypothetical protein n=1 Tax=Labrenzia sp. OB1 TaxID=1561204 RepID=UPI0007B316FC|nr:hypothetical protein [Labrenzia sp. OB1]KZM50829.1 hypothetical protein OA90_07430 [Labrenzia sp. OB1]
MESRKVIELIAGKLRSEQYLQALCLSGSYGAGLEDGFSDIDFLAVLDDRAFDTFTQTWRKTLSTVGEIVLWREFKRTDLLVNAVTADWLRIDLLCVNADRINIGRARNGLEVLFDHAGLVEALPEVLKDAGPDPIQMQYQFEEFIRILGLMPVAMGRQEYFNAVTGVTHLRNLLVNLLIEETRAPHRGGALHLNRLITDEQKELLGSLPALVPGREIAIEAHLAYAAAYLPRARKLADRYAIPWPERFEQVTLSNLNLKLGLDVSHLRD